MSKLTIVFVAVPLIVLLFAIVGTIYSDSKSRRLLWKVLWPEFDMWGSCCIKNVKWYSKPFYTFKALCCIMLDLHEPKIHYDSLIPMVGYDMHQCYADYGHSWDEIGVGHGIFSNWYYTIYSNGT